MSESSSSTPERPVRGKGRGRGRGRGGMRTRGGRLAGTPYAEAALQIVKTRKERLRESIMHMREEQLRETLLSVVEAHPSLLMDVLEPAARQPGGYHPPDGDNTPDWCVCGKCREMPTERERMCCEKRSCLSLLPDFQVYILDEGVLALARLYRQDILVVNDEEADLKRSNRHAAYRQFVLFSHGRLGAGNRVVIPSCCVWAIRDKYPDPFGQYTGFVANRLA